MIAVVLPSVCLLWFMTEAIKNERLAVRQKLIDVCHRNIESFQAGINGTLAEHDKKPNRPFHLVDQPDIAGWVNAIKNDAEGLAIYDAAGKQIYPFLPSDFVADFDQEFQKIFETEQNGDYQLALEGYKKFFEENQDSDLLFESLMGKIRCFDKLMAKHRKFVTEYKNDHQSREKLAAEHKRPDDKELGFVWEILYADKLKIRDKLTPEQIAMIRVKRIEWYDDNMKYGFAASDMFVNLRHWYYPGKDYPPQTIIWALEKIIAIAEKHNGKYLPEGIEIAQKRVTEEKVTLQAATYINENLSIGDIPANKYIAIKTTPALYLTKYIYKDKTIILARTWDSLLSIIESALQKTPVDGIGIKLYDNLENLVLGPAQTNNAPFLTAKLSDLFPGWKLQFYFQDNNIFDQAAGRQTTIYTWTALLVVLLILTTGGFATQTITRQIKLNRLKNDFIATVTHELKTPLASMRVLVDTLLNGSYNDGQQAKEYLELISKENLRLSRLIDNFLTFSRMERNKQAFDIVKTTPAEIASTAADAVHTKFNNDNCKFTLTVDNNLPSVLADKDAMVTVLVNLLDNAYKYSNDDKQISLKVYAEDDSVCFTVTDNGIGMTPRQTKKVFDRFYQADSSLSRQTEGTGLGLSIVKFILDAHKAQVNVESKQTQGSTFTVKLTAVD